MNAYAWPVDVETVIGVPVLTCAYVIAQGTWPSFGLRLVSFAVGQATLLGAFATPVQTIATRYLLSAHLLQNVVVTEWASGLTTFGIAPQLASRLEHVALVRRLTHPLVALPLWLATSFFWHVPWIYDRALTHPHSLLHLEHMTYFVAGVLMWWPVVHGRWSDGAKALYLFAAFVLASPLGLLLALLPHPVYGFYEHAPRLWIGHLADQQIAGLTMAVEQAVVFFGVFAIYLGRFLRHEAILGTFSESRR